MNKEDGFKWNLQQTINRKQFFLGWLSIVILGIMIHYLIQALIPATGIATIDYFSLKKGLEVIYLTLLMPLVVFRLNDLKYSRWWAAFVVIGYFLDLKSEVLLQHYWGIKIDLPIIVLLPYIVISLWLSMVLLLKKGFAVKKGS